MATSISSDHEDDISNVPSIESSHALTVRAPMTVVQAPTILPSGLATLVSRLSYVGTLSIRSSALLAEAALEGARFGTITGLELGRKTLEGLVTGVFDMLVRDSNNFGSQTRGQFGSLVEKYSNLGVYLVHHSFSLAELFSMTGFVLAQSTLSTSFTLAEESVRLLDVMFGSNETSRALASIVLLIARELNDDAEKKSWVRWIMGGASTVVLGKLTRAAVLFACLQMRGFERIRGEIEGRVMWDIVVGRDERDDAISGVGTIEGDATKALVEGKPRTEMAFERSRPISLISVVDDTDDVQLIPMQVDNIDDIDDAATIIDSEEYDQVVHALPREKVLAGHTTATMYEVTTETTVTKTTTVKYLNSQQSNSSDGARTTAMRSRHTNTSTTASKYKIAVQKVTDKLKVKKLGKNSKSSQRAQIEEITEFEPNRSNSHKVWKSIKARVEGSSISAKREAPRPPVKARDTSSQQTIKRVDEPYPPPLQKTRDTRANILRTQAQHSSRDRNDSSRPNVHPRLRVTPLQPVPNSLNTNSSQTVPPSPPSLPSSLLLKGSDSAEHERESVASSSTTKTRVPRRRSSTMSIASFISLRSDSHHHSHVFSSITGPVEPKPTNFPRGHTVKNISKFMRFSSASYGWNFMKLLGIGSIGDLRLPKGEHSVHHANHHAFSVHTELPLDKILLSSYTTSSLGSQAPQLVYFVSVDHAAEAVVLTCRGTLGVADILTDLACDYEELKVWGGVFSAHKGILTSARQLAEPTSKVLRVIREALLENAGYGLVLCGHSLGGGVATLLSILWSVPTEEYVQATGVLYPPSSPFVTSSNSALPFGRPIHSYAYGPPAVVSPSLGRLTAGLVTSVVHGWDVVPSLSVGVIRDLRNVALALKDGPEMIEECRKRLFGGYTNRGKHIERGELNDLDDDEYLYSALQALRHEMKSEKLVPAGQVIVLEILESYSQNRSKSGPTQAGIGVVKKLEQSRKADIRVIAREVVAEQRFGEIVFSKSMFSDHSPKRYEAALEALRRGVLEKDEEADGN